MGEKPAINSFNGILSHKHEKRTLNEHLRHHKKHGSSDARVMALF